MTKRTPTQRPPNKSAPAERALRSDVAAFVSDAKALARPSAAGARGRLVVVLDATMSREATWDAAMSVHADMFAAAEAHGGLDVQLIYFRGPHECRASRWTATPADLARALSAVQCRAGRTQVERALRHALKEAETGRVDAVVVIGDAFEESIDLAADVAGRIAMRGGRVFTFHEGDDAIARGAFAELARAGGGSAHLFDSGAPDVLRRLLGAVAAYASGGRTALNAYAERQGGAAREVAAKLDYRGGT